MKTKHTKVIFRWWLNEGIDNVIAMFPQIAASVDGVLCQSYMHVGQHSAATPELVYNGTRPAIPGEYADLKTELEAIGYRLKIGKRFTQADLRIRQKQYA